MQLVTPAPAAAWLIVEVCPATATLPLRAPPVLAATVNVMVAGPLPCAGDVKVIHAARLAAVHGHPAEVASVNVAPEAAEPIDSVTGVREYAQAPPELGGSGPPLGDWVRVTVWPAT